ncbi:MAG: DUF2997 domain-containing protein [Candidatus Omnitrophota bacterium]
MAGKEELEIEIDSSGEVRVHIKGVKGKNCLQYAKLLEKALGEIKGQELTSEYYEPEPPVKIIEPIQEKRVG